MAIADLKSQINRLPEQPGVYLFLGRGGEILAIRTMEPCPSEYPRNCPSYPAGVEFQGALEVNRGFFRRHGIGTGDRVLLPDGLAERAR